MDLITFQFDRQGGGFVIELARCPVSGTPPNWGKYIPATKVQAWDIHPNFRSRLQQRPGSGTDSWFRFDLETPKKIATLVLAKLSSSNAWDHVEIGRSSLNNS